MVRILTALLLIVAVLIPVGGFHSDVLANGHGQPAPPTAPHPTTQANEIQASATSTDGGVLVQWHTDAGSDNPGFYVYRIQGRRINLIARIPAPESSEGGFAYRWLDSDGNADSSYYIESINTKSRNSIYHITVPVSGGGKGRSLRANGGPSGENAGAGQSVQEFPASMTGGQLPLTETSIIDQWTVAAQSGLKIQIKSDGWYRVTQQQMASAGFNPATDVRNLSLFVNGQETAILTSRDSGQLIPGDFIEFYGQGLNTADTDTRIYYLIAGATPGKRPQGELRTNGDPTPNPAPPQPAPPGSPAQTRLSWIFTWPTQGAVVPLSDLLKPADPNTSGAEIPPAPLAGNTTAPPLPAVAGSGIAQSASATARNRETETVGTTTAPAPSVTANREPAFPAPSPARKRKKGKRSHRRRRSVRVSRPRHNHAMELSSTPVLSFNDSVQLTERFNYNIQLPVGHNFFGSAVGSVSPLTKTLTIHNLQTAADGPAQLEVGLQGISFQSHQVNIFCNNVQVGTMSNFFGHDYSAQTFSVPVSALLEGANAIKIAPMGSGESLGLDHITLTFPHSYRAFNDSLLFSLRSTQSLSVDGFSTPYVRLIDITDPTTIKLTHPVVAASGGGYAITVAPGARAKGARTMYALLDGQFKLPAGFSLNQPSTLNAVSTHADLVIISHKDFLPSIDPLVAQRQSQGLTVLVADVDDVYDEFSFGAHSAQALRDFISYVNTPGHLTPKYIMLVGDASSDPRAYRGNVVTRTKIRQRDPNHPSCADSGNNDADFGMALFPIARNSVFQNNPLCTDASGLVISEIYDGGGDPANNTANGYIELFNRGTTPINVNGWSVQYSSPTGSTWQTTNLTNVTIQPSHYYLVQEAGQGGLFPLSPTPDAFGNIQLSRTAGKVALVNSTTPLIGTCPTGGSVVDFMGFGSSVNCFKGSAPAAVSADFVPTTQVDTVFGAACSDDQLADFNNDGISEIPIGRLPVRTVAEADLMVSKIVTFSKTNVPQTGLFVADAQGTYYWNFETHSDELAALVPAGMAKQKIYLASQASPAACEANIINSINSGVALVNYQGHGNVNVWSGASIFTNDDAHNLTNGNKLPLVIVADCLNGLFDDPVLEGLAETMLRAPLGGAVAAYASSGETIPDGQQEMSIKVYQLLFGAQPIALGDVTKQAKGATNDIDVRRTWILLGDPSMKIF